MIQQLNNTIQFKSEAYPVNYNKRSTPQMPPDQANDLLILQAKAIKKANKKAKSQERWYKAGVLGQVGLAAGVLAGVSLTAYSMFGKGHKTNVLKFKQFAKDALPKLDSDSINPKGRDFINLVKKRTNMDPKIAKYAGTKSAEQCVLYHGPSGTGKTFLAKVTANELDAQYAEVDFPKIASPYVGQASKNIEGIFNEITAKAKASPDKKFLVAFNEIDSMLIPMEKAGNNQSYVLENRTAFLNGLDSIQDLKNVKIVGTTNADPASGNLDLAALSRFGNTFKIDLPTKNEIIASLKWHLKDCEAATKNDFFNKNKTEIDNFADELVRRKFSQRDVEKLSGNAMTRFGINITEKSNPMEQKFDIKFLKEALNSKEFTTGSTGKQNTNFNPLDFGTTRLEAFDNLSFWDKLQMLFGRR